MDTKNNQLYFVALVPSVDVLQKVKQLKEEVAERYESKAALRSPPHITLHMPFRFREDREERIHSVLQKVAANFHDFPVRHSGFGAFPPRVIFVAVEKSDTMAQLRSELIKNMRVDLKLENADYKGQAFNPHMTIAYRDLKKRIFPKAWDHYQNRLFSESWDCRELVLLKHTGASWSIYRSFPLTGNKQLTFFPS